MISLPPLPTKKVTVYLLPEEITALSKLEQKLKLESLSATARYCITKCGLSAVPSPIRSKAVYSKRKRLIIAFQSNEYSDLQNMVNAMAQQAGKEISQSTAIRSAIVYVIMHKEGGNQAVPIEPGTKFGKWTVIGPSLDPLRLTCRCECGTVKNVLKQSLINGQSKSCGGPKCRKITLIEPGTVFGQWTVLGPSKDEEKAKEGYYECRCSCGTVKAISKYSLLRGRSKGCGKCGHKNNKGVKKPAASANHLIKAKEKYEGKTVNNFFIKEVIGKRNNNDWFECVAVCPQCGREFTTRLERIKVIKKCADCNQDMGKKLDAIHNVTKVDGTDLSALRSRVNGTVNKNSTTGVNGVTRSSSGGYRAYINFQRKQITLGSFANLEDAIAARKVAEKELYEKVLEDNAGWEQRLADAMAEYKKSNAKK